MAAGTSDESGIFVTNDLELVCARADGEDCTTDMAGSTGVGHRNGDDNGGQTNGEDCRWTCPAFIGKYLVNYDGAHLTSYMAGAVLGPIIPDWLQFRYPKLWSALLGMAGGHCYS
jgi:hypothetical protein